jgi:hypothetical protein
VRLYLFTEILSNKDLSTVLFLNIHTYNVLLIMFSHARSISSCQDSFYYPRASIRVCSRLNGPIWQPLGICLTLISLAKMAFKV